MIRLSLWSLLSLVSLPASADLVHVVEQTEVGGVTNVVRDTTKLTGMPWATATAPSLSGQNYLQAVDLGDSLAAMLVLSVPATLCLLFCLVRHAW